jgi:hypothetical protein
VAFLRAVIRRLRSRRLAVGLILAVIAYAAASSVIPNAFGSPVFLAVVALLALSTAACAWERTRSSARALRRTGRVDDAQVERLREKPWLTVRVAQGTEGDPLSASADAMRRLRLSVVRGPRLLEASSGRVGLLGSPLFHWTLAVLLLVIALGRLSRAEGAIGVPVGFSRTDATGSYRTVRAGPLYGGHSGLTLAVTDLRPVKDAEGVDRGVSPLVELREGGTLLRRQRVYPNNPLRHGSLLIHSSGYGIAAVVSVGSGSGGPILQSEPLVDFDAKRPGGTTAAVFDLTAAGGKVLDSITLTIPLDREGGLSLEQLPRRPRALVTVRASGVETSAVLEKGGSMRLPTGESLRVKDFVHYARLTVADDWSVYPIYFLFVLAGIAMSVSVTVPYRRVRVLLAETADGVALHAEVRHSRGDPLFAEMVETALREAAGAAPVLNEESA